MGGSPTRQLLRNADALRLAGRLGEAVAACRQALLVEPRSAAATHLLALLEFERSGDAGAAIDALRRSIEFSPGVAAFHANLGAMLGRAGRPTEAERALREAVRLAPADAAAHDNLGSVLERQGRYAEAEQAFRTAMRLGASVTATMVHLGNVLRKQDRFAAAVDAYAAALARSPADVDARLGVAAVLMEDARPTEALVHLRRAIEVEPSNTTAHAELGKTLLLLGRFEEGWAEHEWRWRQDGPHWGRRFATPRWDGSDLAGRTILLHGEGGLGNTIQFVRFASRLASRGAGRVVLECRAELCDLLRGAVGVDDVAVAGGPAPTYDVHLPLLSLPFVLREPVPTTTTLDVPYLRPDPARVERMRPVVRGEDGVVAEGGTGGLVIGINWQADPRTAYGRSKSIPLQLFEPLAQVAGVRRLIGLHVGLASAGRPPDVADRFAVTELPGMDEPPAPTIADVAAVIACLDLVVSVDTSTAHLAGALGVPVWIALRTAADWRWMLDRSDSPWYPNARLFRQPRPADWAAVVDQMAAALASTARGDAQLLPRL